MKKPVVVGYSLTPQPDHDAAPDAWATYVRLKTINAAGDIEIRSVLIGWGLTLAESLTQISLYDVGHPVDWWNPLWENNDWRLTS